MFVRKSKHDAEVKRLNAEIVSLIDDRDEWKRGAKHWEAKRNEAVDKLRDADDGRHGADRTAAMYKKLYEGATAALRKIAAQETPTANATVKRMANIARAELPVTHHDAVMITKPADSSVAATH